MRYTAYGLQFDSELDLPELTPAIAPHPEPDVRIRRGTVDPHGLPEGRQMGPFLWVSADALWLQVPRVACYLIRGGNSIVIDPAPGIDDNSLRVFLLGSVLGALLFQRGQLVLHGNAIRIGDACMVCVGDSGAGKSTLTAGFLQRGYDILADDVVPVDGDCRTISGYPRIKLWQNVAERLGIETGSLHRIRPDLEKFNYPLGERFAVGVFPVRWIYVLNVDNEAGVRIQALQGIQRYEALHRNTYRMRFLKGMSLQASHLQRCGQLAGRIHMARVTRSSRGFDLDGLIDRLLIDVGQHP